MRIIDEIGKIHSVSENLETHNPIYFSTLCYKNDGEEVDFYNSPLVFTKNYIGIGLLCTVGKHNIILPADWQILTGSEHSQSLELEMLLSCCKQDISVFSYNPNSSFVPQYKNIEVKQIYFDYEWSFPQIKTGHFLGVPISDEENTECVWIVQNTRFMPKYFDVEQIL